jgi:hypothetical protein
MITCPACAGPQALGGDCATCLGVTEVTQAAHEAFLIQKQKQEEYFSFVSVVKGLLDSGIDEEMSFAVNGELFTYPKN